MKRYTVRRVAPASLARMDFSVAEEGFIDCVRPESSEHHPQVEFRLLHDAQAFYLAFKVYDRYVRVAHAGFQSKVYLDSCVEFFVKPFADRGYFNFEMNAGGSLLLTYIEDPTRLPEGGFAKYRPVAEDWCDNIAILTSLPPRVDPERSEPTTWHLRCRIPFALFDAYVGPVVREAATWHANFYKCGDETSHPHWLSWSPVTGALNFHQPSCFGMLVLE